MQAFYALATFTTSPQVLTALTFKDSKGNSLATAPTRCTRLYVEPASGSGVQFVEVLGVATGATGGTDGVIRQIAKFSATGPLDSWEIADQKGGNLIDTTQFQFDGTAGETMRVTLFVA